MIEHLSGVVLARLPNAVVVDVQGVGYGVEMPLSSLCEIPARGQKIKVWIDTYVREDAFKLYGFLTFDDKQAFVMLRGVSGIGPKIALAVLSTLDARSLRQTVLTNRVELLESVPGIGKRTAEKLMLDLRPKMEKMSFISPFISNESKTDALKQSEPQSDFDEFGVDETQSSGIEQHLLDLRSALENLGYRDKEILPVVALLRTEYQGAEIQSFQSVLKSALKTMRIHP